MSLQNQRYPTWICSQIGAREHFAIPRALVRSGRLATLYTDFWAGPVLRQLSVGGLRPLAARFHPDLNDHPGVVQSWNLRSLGWEYCLRQQSAIHTPYHGFIEVGRRFAIRVRETLKRRRDLTQDSVFYAYDTGALEAMEWCHEHGIKTVLNQIDPNRVEAELVQAEEKQWIGWALRSVQVPDEYFARREREWALAERVVVNSEFSRQALLQQGVPAAKLAVVPLCYETGEIKQKAESRRQKADSTLRVLFLGQVILRKGIQYLIEAAKLLKAENIQFDVVGPVGISEAALKSAPANVIFHGRATRDKAAEWYGQSDVFVLPTLSDGFAITQLEAMAHGLPVIASRCCGEVVSHGLDGFVVPPRDVQALVRAFETFLEKPEMLRNQSSAALLKARQFTIQRLSENLSRLEDELAVS